MIIEIITIGDEILSGNILDTNKQYLSDALWSLGFKVYFHTGVRDDEKDITDALIRASKRANAVLVTGGLGPTVDDFTIDVAAKAFGVELVEDKETTKTLTDWYAKKNMPLRDNNRKQALIPKGAKALPNRIGTAPGVYYVYNKVPFFFMPGVPSEMKALFNHHVLPILNKEQKDPLHFKTRFLKTFGSSESELDHTLKDLFHDRTEIDNARIGYRFHFPEITLKVSVWDQNENKAVGDLENVVNKIKDKVGQFVYSENVEDTLEKVCVEKLKQKTKTVALAESCTGGLVSSRITSVPGSSEVFLGSVICYSNEVKRDVLRVSERTLTKYGAVSKECATEMVNSIKDLTGADYCVAITGVAGPTGGTKNKPVGTVFIAYLLDDKITVKEHHLDFDRVRFQELVSSIVLAKLVNCG